MITPCCPVKIAGVEQWVQATTPRSVGGWAVLESLQHVRVTGLLAESESSTWRQARGEL